MSTGRPRVFITRRIPASGLDLLKEHCDVSQWDSDDAIPRAELLARVTGVDAIFCLLTEPINAELLDAAGRNLKVVSTMSVGYDHVDTVACKSRGVQVGFTPDVLTNAVAELTIALLLATSRRLFEATRAVKTGLWGPWKPLWLCGQGLDEATVGIIGFGRIGYAVAERIKPFGVKRIVYTDSEEKTYGKNLNAEYLELDQLLAMSDFVIGCCALTPETRGLMNASAFRKMKNTAIFVNTSRGGLVNQEDLYQALTGGEIWAAGLDVTNPEPMPTDHPLLKLDNCVVLPHIASATLNARGAMSELCARNILAVFKGDVMPAKVL